jgi:type IV fimbrial biogenesis protein FimT
MHSKAVNCLGFTLVELMITVAIVGIVASIGVPSFQEMLNQNRASSLANELATSLNLARSEAIKRGAQVSVCKSGNVTASSPTCSTAASWKDGWLIFVDKGTAGTFDNGSDTRLKVGQPSNSNANINGYTNFANYVAYLPSGMSKGNSLPNGSLDICVDGVQRSIKINSTGRSRLSKGTC